MRSDYLGKFSIAIFALTLYDSALAALNIEKVDTRVAKVSFFQVRILKLVHFYVSGPLLRNAGLFCHVN